MNTHNDYIFKGQAYILSLKNGSNSIVINGAANEAYDPKMTELDPAWAEAITSCKLMLNNDCYIQQRYFCFRGKCLNM